MARAGFTRSLLLAALVAAFAGCGNEDLDTGEPVPPATEVVTETAGGETTTGGQSAEGDPQAGEAVFASAGCTGCHTLAAADSSGTVGPNLDEAKPSFDEAVTVITGGRGGMPSFDGQLSEQQIRDVAAFVAESAGS